MALNTFHETLRFAFNLLRLVCDDSWCSPSWLHRIGFSTQQLDAFDPIRPAGDGIQPGQLTFTTTPNVDQTQLTESLPKPPPLMDIMPEVNPVETGGEELSSLLSSESVTADFGDSPALAGLPQTTGTSDVAPQFRSRRGSVGGGSKPDVASNERLGNDGLGGDGQLENGPPNPSARNKPPIYPPEARRKHIEGTVQVAATITRAGKVAHASVRQSSGFAALDNAALEAVRKWEFDSIHLQNDSESLETTVLIHFDLK